MKQILMIAICIAGTFTSYSQSLGYQDLAILFSENDHYGTARFTAMGTAFGAVGGDISGININPAGIAVYKNSLFSGTFNSRETNIATNYYGNSVGNQNEYFNIPQAGAVLVFDTYDNSDWSKVVFGVNYRIKKDFNNYFLARGNSGIPTFTEFPLDENTTPIYYNNSEEQSFNNTYNGEVSEFSAGIAAVHDNKLHVGIALNTYDLTFSQRATLTEFNNDGNGNNLEATFYQENTTLGSAFSLNMGFIYKANRYFRFGLAYQSPTWFTEISEETNIVDNDGFFGDTEITVSNDTAIYANTANNYFPIQSFLYKLRTPSKLTASTAFIFGKSGLISFDYTRKNHQNMRLSNGDFSSENQFFQNELKNTNTFNVGTEWRFGRMSVRGGYQYEENPYQDALETDHLKRYSFGGGYHFGDFKIDFSYSDASQTSAYNFYAQFNNINAANLTIDNRIFTTTLTLNL